MKEGQKNQRYQIQRGREKERMFLQPVKKCMQEGNRYDGRKISKKGAITRKRTVRPMIV